MAGMLENLSVVDMTNNIAGPGCAAMMADQGAEVIHIEKPVWGDDCRHFYPQAGGASTAHYYINRGKRSVVVDLKDPDGAALVHRMAASADVLIESGRPGVMERLGLGYQHLRKDNPRLIYCSISAFGQKGPYAGKAGYDIIAQAYSGMMYYTGDPGGKPVKNYFSIGDFVAAYNAYGSVMTALYHRTVTGRGQHVDVSLARGLLTMNMCISDQVTGLPRQKPGNHDGHLCPYGIFNGPGGSYIVIGAINVTLWAKLCTAMGRPELAQDPRYMTNDARCQRSAEVISLIESWLGTFDSPEAAEKVLTANGVPNIKVYTVDDILNDVHARDQGWIREIPLPPSASDVGTCPGAFGFADYSDAEILLSRAHDLGEDNIEVLTRFGMTREGALKKTEKWMRGE